MGLSVLVCGGESTALLFKEVAGDALSTFEEARLPLACFVGDRGDA